jgi:hypothetical protein
MTVPVITINAETPPEVLAHIADIAWRAGAQKNSLATITKGRRAKAECLAAGKALQKFSATVRAMVIRNHDGSLPA